MTIVNRSLALTMLAGSMTILIATNAAAESEIRAVTGFTAIAVGGGIDLTVRQGDEFRVEAHASSGSPESIVTTIEGGTLEIRKSRTTGFLDWFRFSSYSVDVTLPQLTALASSGGSNVQVEGTISGASLEIAASGGSDVRIDLAVDRLVVATSGGADVRISGTADAAQIQSSGGSEINARDLHVLEAEVQSSGGADVAIAVSERLVAQASGGSDIVYTGDPVMADVDTSGGAEVSRR